MCQRHHRDEGGQNRKIAMRQVHDAHDPEHDREPRREEGKDTPEKDALQERVEKVHELVATFRDAEVGRFDVRSFEVRGFARQHGSSFEEADDFIGDCQGL